MIMDTTLAIRRLYWKEARQLYPLAIGLVVMAVFATAGALLSSSRSSFPMPVYILLGIPNLFAVACGAVLVAQEKESRTMQWMQSMPLSQTSIFKTKFVTALVGLGVSWLISLAIVGPWLTSGEWKFATTRYYNQFIPWETSPILMAGFQSLFLACASLAITWRYKSAMIGLWALIPISVIPSLTIVFLMNVYGRFIGNVSASATTWLTCSSTLIAAFVAAVLAHRYSKQALAAEQPKSINRFAVAIENSIKVVKPKRVSLASARVMTPFAGLTRQFVRRSMLSFAISVVGLLLLAPFLLMQVFASESLVLGLPVGFAVAICIWLSFLGVYIYSSDRLLDRVRFLVDRGISSRLVWWSRLLPTLILVFIAFSCFAWLASHSVHRAFGMRSREATGDYSVVFNGLLWLGVFGLAQWSGQLSYSRILGWLQTPVVLLVSLSAVYYAQSLTGVPYWLLAILAIIPFAATRLTMQDWMERRFGIRFWAIHSGLALFCAIALLGPGAWYYSTMYRLPESVAMEIELEQRRWQIANHDGPMIGIYAQIDRVKYLRSKELQSMTYPQYIDYSLQKLESQLQESQDAIQSSDQLANFLMAQAAIARFEYVDADEATKEKSKNRYQQLMSIVLTIIPRMRLNYLLSEQDIADRFEVILLRELKQPGASDLLSESIMATARKQLGDREARLTARRRAIALSWTAYVRKAGQTSDVNRIGNWHTGVFDTSRLRKLLRYHWAMRGKNARIVNELWFRMNDPRHQVTTEEWVRLSKLLQDVPEIDQPPDGLTPTYRMLEPSRIAELWQTAWEDEAERFSRMGVSP
jgi:ABC-type transport system involved in multi-copper enzyme maturation permease subunit